MLDYSQDSAATDLKGGCSFNSSSVPGSFLKLTAKKIMQIRQLLRKLS